MVAEKSRPTIPRQLAKISSDEGMVVALDGWETAGVDDQGSCRIQVYDVLDVVQYIE